MLFKLLGAEVETAHETLFVALPGIGELWIETCGRVRGRRWADYMAEGGSLILYLGRTHIVFSPARSAPLMSVA